MNNEKRKPFNDEEINLLACRLAEYSLDVLSKDESTAENKRDFDEVIKVLRAKEAVTILLEYMN